MEDRSVSESAQTSAITLGPRPSDVNQLREDNFGKHVSRRQLARSAGDNRMARIEGETMRPVIWGFTMICVLHLSIPASATSNGECPDQVRMCTCLYGGEGIDVANMQGDNDHRTVGLAAATGVLGGVLATGAALAAYLHFQGRSGGIPGSGSRPGAGRGGNGHGGPSYRPDSTGSSGDSQGSSSPLTKRDRGDKLQSRVRPFTGFSGTSKVTNIYRHPKVWTPRP